METIPSFLTFDNINQTITFFPILESHLGSHLVSIMLSDGLDTPIYQFNVIVKQPVLLPSAI